MLIIDGKKISVPGLVITNYVDHSSLLFKDAKDYGFRATSWVRSIVLHTRMGIHPQQIIVLDPKKKWGFVGISNASADDRHASWHITIDSTGEVYCHLDLKKHKAYHASQVNDVSIGIEIYQDNNGNITQESLNSAVILCDFLTKYFGIQRQYPAEIGLCRRLAAPVKGSNPSSALAYMPGGQSGVNYVGICGHRNITKNRGQGDPGDLVFAELAKAGYEKFKIDDEDDLHTWEKRQQSLGMHEEDADGVPGPKTINLIKAVKSSKTGLWVARPGD